MNERIEQMIDDIVEDMRGWEKTDLLEYAQEERLAELKILQINGSDRVIYEVWSELPPESKTPIIEEEDMGFKGVIKANNEARGHTGNPYAYLVVDEEHGIISFSAVRDFNGRDDTFSGSQPLRGKDVEAEVYYIFTLLRTWAREGNGIWIDLSHTPKAV